VVESEKSMLLSRKEVGGELGISPDSVTRLTKNGELKAVEFPKMGGRGKNVKRMFEREEIDRFKARNGGRG
jgi:hypothetical protein